MDRPGSALPLPLLRDALAQQLRWLVPSGGETPRLGNT